MKRLGTIVLAIFICACVPQKKETTVQVENNTQKTAYKKASYQEPVLSPEEEAVRLMIFSSVGEGIPPQNTVSQAQALALAKRAALADAYRQLAGKLYGVRVNSRENVKDAMLRSSLITTYVNGLIKNANITGEGFKDGLYTVELELKIDKYKWNELFSY